MNNFADLSLDLLEELKEILDEDDLEPEELEEVMSLLSSNLKKIVHHGNRADKIVKGMLLHSRGKSGEREETDINSLLEEYLNLALKQYSEDKKKVFNTRGKAFKSINLDIKSLSREEIIQLLSSDGKLIKRPFLIYEEKKVVLGFNEIEYTKQFI